MFTMKKFYKSFFFFKLAPFWKAKNCPEGGGRTQSHGEFQVEAQGLTEAEMGTRCRGGKARKRQRQMESWGRVRLREPER